MKFENLRKLVIEEFNGYKNGVIDRLNNGDENALMNWSTNRRFEQYENNAISKDQLIKYAKVRVEKYYNSLIEKELTKIEKVESAKLPDYITVSFSWTYTQYYICHANVWIDGREYNKRAGGCGYDKESTACALCFNDDYGLLKYLYIVKNNHPNIKNRDLLGYGSGYSSLPCFETAVGMNSIVNIMKNIGFRCDAAYGKKGNTYIFIKEVTR